MPHPPHPARAAAAAATLLFLAAGCGSDDPAQTAPTAAATPAAPLAGAGPGGGAAGVLAATRQFLALLDDAGRAGVQGERTPGNLARWSGLPDRLFPRAGLRMDALSGPQRAAAHRILEAGLSADGYAQLTGITGGDGAPDDPGRTDPDAGAGRYRIRILGTPSEGDPWTVQYGGHHLAVNLTVKGGQMTMAPTLWGAQPVPGTADDATAGPLSGETVKALALIGALDTGQRDAAVLDAPISEIVLGARQDGRTPVPEGVQAAGFTAAQQDLLLALITEWLSPLDEDDAAAKIAAAEAGLDRTWFAWSGGTTAGESIYYRVQGPTLIIEFARQQGPDANAGGVPRIRSIYREPDNDYGAGLS